MKYAIIKVTDGNFNIHAEGFTTIDAARSEFYGLCKALINDKPTKTACVMITDENLNGVGDGVREYKEFISHPEES